MNAKGGGDNMLEAIRRIENEANIRFAVVESHDEIFHDESKDYQFVVVIDNDTITHLCMYDDVCILVPHADAFKDIKFLEISAYRKHISTKGLSKFASKLKNLTSLGLFGCTFEGPLDFIVDLQSLESLDLFSNSLEEIPEEITKLKNLTRLDIVDNNVTEIPACIGELTKLQTLNLHKNHICEAPDIIGKLTNLVELDLWSNKLNEIPAFIYMLKQLRKLDMFGNEISKIPDSISQLDKLTFLDIGDNPIAILPGALCEIVSLESLSLQHCPITRFPDNIANLRNLSSLNICNTLVDQLPASIFSLGKLKSLDLSYNELETIPKEILDLNIPFSFDSSFDRDEPGIFINDLKIQEMDVEMFRKPREHIEEYYKELEHDSVRLNEARVIFIGHGDAGKTSIINRLITGEFVGGSSATRGITIAKHNFPFGTGADTVDVAVSFWDFGGQDIMHSMHEFFLGERCVYVIVLDGRRDEEPKKWLDLVAQYGKDSAVMVVMNKIDEPSYESLDINGIKRDYGNTFSKLHFNYISCFEGTHFDEFKNDFLNMVKGSKAYNKVFPGRWNKIKNRVAEQPSNYIDEADFKEYCNDEGITNDFNQQILLEWLHDLGICFSYESKNLLGNVEGIKVLRPEWITNGIYKIITSQRVRDTNGFLPHPLIRDILSSEEGENEKYRNTEHGFILGMMHNFELSYYADNSEFIPMLTNAVEPDDIPINYDKSIHYKIKYSEILPSAILYQFIVRMQKHVDTQYTWRRGCVLRSPYANCKALLLFGKGNDELHLYVEGNKDAASFYLLHIINEFKDVKSGINLKYTESVEYLHQSGKSAFIDLESLEIMLNHGRTTYFDVNLVADVNVLDILKSFKPISVILELEKQLREKSSFDSKLDAMNIKIDAIGRNISSLLSTSDKITKALAQIDENQDSRLAQLQDFIAENSDVISRISNASVLLAIDDLTAEIKKKSKKSIGARVIGLVGILSSVVTLVASGPGLVENDAVVTFLEMLLTRIADIFGAKAG